MKTAQEYFDEYAVSHQNKTNQTIHYICVPLIFFSVIGLLMSIPTTSIRKYFWFIQSFIRKLGSCFRRNHFYFLLTSWFLVLYRNAICYFSFNNW